MNDNIENNIIELNDSYSINVRKTNDILNDIEFVDNEERFLCESIITNLEKHASENIRNMKVVQLPFIGCVRINPVKRELRDNYKNFRIARKNMNKEQYKDHVRAYVYDIKEKQKKLDRLKTIFYKIRRHNKSKYDLYFKKLGKAYADMFIYSIFLLKEVPFDEEFENHYQSLKD